MGNIGIIDAATNTVLTGVSTGPSPSHPASSRNGRILYFPDAGANRVSIVDPAEGTVGAVITDSSFSQPMAVAVTPSQNELWVLNRTGGPEGDGSISIVDLGTRTVLEELSLPEFSLPEHLVISSRGTGYVVNTGSGTVSVLLTLHRQRLLTLDVGGAPTFALIDPEGRDVFVSNGADQVVTRIHTDDHSLTDFMMPGPPQHLAFRDNLLYVALSDNRVGVLDPANGRLRIVRFANRLLDTFGITLVNGSSRAYVSDSALNQVVGFDTVTLREISGLGFPLNNFGQPRDLISVGRVRIADLSVRIIADSATVLNRGELTYTITVENAGPSTATEISLRDELFVGTEVEEIQTPQGTCSQSSTTLIECSLGSLPQGGRIRITLRVRPGSEGEITNEVSVSGAESDPDVSNNSAGLATTVQPATDLALNVVANPVPVAVGQLLTYQIEVNNPGASVARNIRLTLQLSGNSQFESSLPEIGCSILAQSFVCSLPLLNPQEQFRLLLRVVPRNEGFVHLLAFIRNSTADPNESNDSASLLTPVTSVTNVSDLQLIQTVDKTAVNPEETLSFRLEANNLGPDAVPNSSVLVRLSKALIFKEVFASPLIICTEESNEITCKLGAIAAEGQASLVVRARAAPDARGLLKSWASLSGIGIDPNPLNNIDRVEVLVLGSGDFNRDGDVDATDLQLLILEINDGDGTDPGVARGSGFPGSADMDLNIDNAIDMADVDLLIRYIFAQK